MRITISIRANETEKTESLHSIDSVQTVDKVGAGT